MNNKFADNNLSAYYVISMMQSDSNNDWTELYELSEYMKGNIAHNTYWMFLSQTLMILEEFGIVESKGSGASTSYRLTQYGRDYRLD